MRDTKRQREERKIERGRERERHLQRDRGAPKEGVRASLSPFPPTVGRNSRQTIRKSLGCELNGAPRGAPKLQVKEKEKASLTLSLHRPLL